MKLEITTNFSFGKLANKLPNLLQNHVNNVVADSVESSKNYIKSGSVIPDIKEVTKKRRIRRGNPPTPPLLETGRLVKSIKQVDDGIEMIQYGRRHHFGDGRPKRKFIQSVMSEKNIKKFFKSLKNAMRLN